MNKCISPCTRSQMLWTYSREQSMMDKPLCHRTDIKNGLIFRPIQESLLFPLPVLQPEMEYRAHSNLYIKGSGRTVPASPMQPPHSRQLPAACLPWRAPSWPEAAASPAVQSPCGSPPPQLLQQLTDAMLNPAIWRSEKVSDHCSVPLLFLQRIGVVHIC